MSDSAKSIHKFVRTHRPTEGQGYSSAVRARVVRYVRPRRASGQTWTALSLEVGLSTTTLIQWCRDDQDAPQAEAPTFLPVHIAPTPPPPAPAPVRLSLTSPNGWRVDGLDLASLAQLLPVLS